jgi:4-hydroxy-tetrahydrodipicolinate reductase
MSEAESIRVLVVGRGRMGRLVETLAPDYGASVVGVVGRDNASRPDSWPRADVAVDFSTADAVPINARRLIDRGVNVVIGTTGWQAHESSLRDYAASRPVGIVAAPNFALGVNLFLALAARAAELFGPRPEFGSWVHEAHHAAKRDAPSGTALALLESLKSAGFARAVDVACTRAGSIPGTHTLGFDAAAETVIVSHCTRDRSVFARGALDAARWVHGRRGWFTMKDVLGL